jgi:hypothetical protein
MGPEDRTHRQELTSVIRTDARKVAAPGPETRAQRRPDVVRLEPSSFWRGTPATQHKPTFRSDSTSGTLIDTAANDL